MTMTIPPPREAYYSVDSPHEVARWRPLVNWLLFIPHGVILYAMRTLACVIGFVYWAVLIATGRLDRDLYGMMVLYERYNARTTGFLVGFSETYPGFDFRGGGTDNGAYPAVKLDLPEPPSNASRTLAFQPLLAIPHYLMFAVLAVAALMVAVIGWFAVLITGRWPEGLRAFLVRVNNYYFRVWLYAAMVEPRYPPFRLPDA